MRTGADDCYVVCASVYLGASLWTCGFEVGISKPQEGGYYKWVQEALGEFWGFQAGWWRTISIYIDNTLYVILAGGIRSRGLGLIPGCGVCCEVCNDSDLYHYQHPMA